MKITVLTGGTSSERDVAIASAVQIVAALRSRMRQIGRALWRPQRTRGSSAGPLNRSPNYAIHRRFPATSVI